MRELTGDLYFGDKGGKNSQGAAAWDVAVYTTHEVEEWPVLPLILPEAGGGRLHQ